MIVKYIKHIETGMYKGQIKTSYCLFGIIPLFIKYEFSY